MLYKLLKLNMNVNKSDNGHYLEKKTLPVYIIYVKNHKTISHNFEWRKSHYHHYNLKTILKLLLVYITSFSMTVWVEITY